MTLDEMRKHKWSVSWSGGKDSTATIILMYEYGVPIESITYVRMMYDDNIPATLPIMTDFVNKATNIFESWGYKVNIVPSIKTAKQLCLRKYKRSSYKYKNGHVYGITSFVRGRCNMSGCKVKTIENLKQSKYQMVGYAYDETNRIHRLTDTKCSIMVELRIKEAETFDICKKYNLLSPMYELGIKRDGCWFCPNASKKLRDIINEQYPELKKEIIKMIEMCDYDLTSLIKSERNTWLTDYVKEHESQRR